MTFIWPILLIHEFTSSKRLKKQQHFIESNTYFSIQYLASVTHISASLQVANNRDSTTILLNFAVILIAPVI